VQPIDVRRHYLSKNLTSGWKVNKFTIVRLLNGFKLKFADPRGTKARTVLAFDKSEIWTRECNEPNQIYRVVRGGARNKRKRSALLSWKNQLPLNK
jgi:hypothetical protein